MNNWPIVKIGEVLSLDLDRVEIDPTISYPMVGVYSFGRGLFDREPVHGGNTSYKNFYRLRPDHIVMSQLFGWEGALALSSAEFSGKFVSPQFPTFVANEEKLDRRYLGWYIRRPPFWEELGTRTRGMGDRRRTLNPEALLSCEIPLPPLSEQQRIVAKIEQLAAKIEEAHGLRHYSSTESQSIIGNVVRDTFTKLPDKNWRSGRLGDYVIDCCYGTSEKTFDEPIGTPILRMGNIQNGALDTRDLKYLHIVKKDRDKWILHHQDIIVNRTNSAELVGKCAIFDLEGDWGFASYLIRLRLDLNRADARLVARYINSPIGREYMFRERKQMTGQANVNSKKLNSLPVNLPPLDEQRRIVAYLDGLQAQVDRLKALQAQTAAELEALLPSILDKAFKGEL